MPAAPAARRAAKSDKFGIKVNGQLFINFLHENDATQGTNHTHGHNGIAPELELNMLAKVSDNIEVGARIQSRYRENYWATFWDMAVHNGNIERPGLFKLRGSWADVRTPDWLKGIVDRIHIGSSDLAMFSPYTIGRLRYIDRDNAGGLFMSAKPFKMFSYDAARISLPSLWAGPGWRTAGTDYDNQLYINKDYAFAGKIDFKPNNQYDFRVIAYHTSDLEVDPDDTNSRDGIDFTDRFKSTIFSVEFDANPGRLPAAVRRVRPCLDHLQGGELHQGLGRLEQHAGQGLQGQHVQSDRPDAGPAEGRPEFRARVFQHRR